MIFLDYEKRVYFKHLNGGEAILIQRTPTGSEVIDIANGQASTEVKRFPEDKALQVMALNQSFKGIYLNIN